MAVCRCDDCDNFYEDDTMITIDCDEVICEECNDNREEQEDENSKLV